MNYSSTTDFISSWIMDSTSQSESWINNSTSQSEFWTDPHKALDTTDDPSITDQDTNSTCPDQAVYKRTFLHGAVGVAVIIILIFAFLERRTKKYLDCCGGRPGLVIPINMLDDYENRWAYAFAFGAVTNTVVVIFTSGSELEYDGPIFTKVIVGVLLIVEICVNLYPFFACLATSHKIAGAITGFLYASLWFGVTLYFMLQCLNPIPTILPYSGLVIQFPTLLCLGVLAIWFLVSLGMVIYRKCKKKQKEDNTYKVARRWQIDYVKDLLKKPSTSDDVDGDKISCGQKVKNWINQNIYEAKYNFKYSARICCTLFVVFMCTYQLGVVYFWVNAKIIDWLNFEFYIFLDRLDLPANHTIVLNVKVSADILSIGWQTVTAFTLLLFVFNILVIFIKYRSHMLRLYRGDRSFVPADLDPDPAELMRYCMLYSGFQVGYMIWGFFVTNFVMWIIILLIGFALILPAMNGYYNILQWLAEIAVIPFVLNFILRIVQRVMAKAWFLQPKVNKTDKYKPLAISNRKAFHIANYFFFFGNITTGLFSCLLRILKSLALGLVYLGRLDRCVLIEGWESNDIGFCAYLGMIHIEVAHNHPVLRVFCQHLLDRLTSQTSDEHEGDTEITNGGPDVVQVEPMQEKISLTDFPDDTSAEKHESSSIVARKARKRWYLFYTLINNPQLIPDRNINIADKIEAVQRKVDINVVIARKQRYEALKKQMEDLEREIRGDEAKDSKDIKGGTLAKLVTSVSNPDNMAGLSGLPTPNASEQIEHLSNDIEIVSVGNEDTSNADSSDNKVQTLGTSFKDDIESNDLTLDTNNSNNKNKSPSQQSASTSSIVSNKSNTSLSDDNKITCIVGIESEISSKDEKKAKHDEHKQTVSGETEITPLEVQIVVPDSELSNTTTESVQL